MVDEARLRKELDEMQCQAALQVQGPVLILAGAGSGKTRAVTYKIAHLISAHGVDPRRILAVTFTNKAAKEMKERIHRLLGGQSHLDWMGTFHGICLRILKLCLGQPIVAERMGWTYSRNFTIYDSDDQTRTLKAVVVPILGEVEAAELRKIQGKISRYKNSLCAIPDPTQPLGIRMALQTPEAVTEQARFREEEQVAAFYTEYQNRLMAADAMDFDDLLFRTVQLFQKMPNIAQQFANRFQQVFVDEFQDTNDIQYLLMRAMMNPQRNVTVVGDDDQSIYGWRGANIGIIRSFHEDFAPVHIVKLERNYRSTSIIVRGAGSVIANNERPEAMRKNVFSTNEGGDPIKIFRVGDDRTEADRIAETIMVAGPASYNQTAIFYRTNAQSRALEKALNDRRIPSVIFGGTRFWDRKEVKDVLAYLRLLVNPRDDAALGRIINVPPRGIGKTTIEDLQKQAHDQRIGMWEALVSLVLGQSKVGTKLKGFYDLMEELRTLQNGMALPLFAEKVLEKTRYSTWLSEDDKEQAEERLANIGELVNALREYEEDHPEAGLEQFLQEVALLSDADKNVDEDRGKVTLMTIHMAKGLEFENVHIAGCDEGLFPLIRKGALANMTASEQKAQEEEERRLFYVGATRAKLKLYLYSATQRFWQGTVQPFRQSRFLEEMDDSTVERMDLAPSGGDERFGDRIGRPGWRSEGSGYSGSSSGNRYGSGGYGRGNYGGSGFGSGQKPSPTIRKVYPGGIPDPDAQPKAKPAVPVREVVYDEHSQVGPVYKSGVMVRHARFGVGLIRGVMGQGPDARIDVEFQDGVTRKLVMKYANLTVLQRE